VVCKKGAVSGEVKKERQRACRGAERRGDSEVQQCRGAGAEVQSARKRCREVQQTAVSSSEQKM